MSYRDHVRKLQTAIVNRVLLLSPLFPFVALVACDVPITTLDREPSRAIRSSNPGIGAIGHGVQVIPDRYIVLFDRSRVTDVQQQVATLLEGTDTEVHRIYEHAVHGFSATITDAEVLKRMEAVTSIRSISNDRVFHDWLSSADGWGLSRITHRWRNTSGVFNGVGSGDGVRIYIVDSGIYQHNDFAFGRIHSSFFDATPGDGQSGGDCHQHGTGVAGVAAGNTYGIARSSVLYRVRVTHGCGSQGSAAYEGDVIAGLDWIHENHDTISAPAVINISGTYAGTPGLAFQEAVLALLDDVGPVVVAAGNAGEDACDYYPSGMSDSTSVITVAASDSLDARLEWGGDSANLNSNWGSCVTVFAPGEFILTADRTGSSATALRSGTSFAAPHVTGIAAIYLENNPTATPSQVRDAIVGLATTGVLSNVNGSPNKLAFTPQPVSAFVDGHWAPAPGSPIWHSNPEGGDLANYTFLWSRRLHYSWGSGSWVNVGTSETVQLYLDANHPNFTLRVVVTSAGYQATDSMYVFGPCNKWGECP